MSITDDDVENSGLDMLLIQRRRIVNNAKNKALTFKNLIEQEFHSRGNLAYSLVYSPEGFDDDLGFIEEDEEMSRRIHEYTKIIMDLALFKKGYFENMRHADKGTSYMVKVVGPSAQDRHVKLNDFKSTAWKAETVDKVLPALFGEMSRIFTLKGYAADKNFENYDFKYIENGQNFQIFEKVYYRFFELFI